MSGARFPLGFADYARHDASGLALLVRRGELEPTEILAAAVARLEAVNPVLNAVVLRHEEAASRQIADGLPAGGLLCGAPFLLKDLHTELAGTASTNGSAFFHGRIASSDSTIVSRHKAAGLVIFGKTHSPELGGTSTSESRLFGATRNPWNLALSAGGSSGGAAAAVAAGIVPAAAASDAGGSITIPASCCGLFGFKPTRGRVPLGPSRFEGGAGLAVLHALTRSVRDSATLLDATAGPEPGALYASPSTRGTFLAASRTQPGRLRIALMVRPFSGGEPAPECREAVEAVARLCQALGHHVEAASPQVDRGALADAERALRGASLVATIRARESELGRGVHENDLEPVSWTRYRAGLSVTGAEVVSARETLFQTHRRMASFLECHDLILSPTMACLPPPLGSLRLDRVGEEAFALNRLCTAYVGPYSLTGQPAMSVPLHRTTAGLPIGVLFAGRFGEEALLLRLAAQLERERPWAATLPVMASGALGRI